MAKYREVSIPARTEYTNWHAFEIVDWDSTDYKSIKAIESVTAVSGKTIIRGKAIDDITKKIIDETQTFTLLDADTGNPTSTTMTYAEFFNILDSIYADIAVARDIQVTANENSNDPSERRRVKNIEI